MTGCQTPNDIKPDEYSGPVTHPIQYRVPGLYRQGYPMAPQLDEKISWHPALGLSRHDVL